MKYFGGISNHNLTSVLNSRKSQNINNRLKAELVLAQLIISEEEQALEKSSGSVEDIYQLESTFAKRIDALKRVNRTLELAIR